MSLPETERISDESPVLEVQDVTRNIAYRRILSGVSFEVRRGQALAVVGPNGAGKTTLLRVITGLARPSSGSIVLRGTAALVAHQPMVYDALSARENLKFFAHLVDAPSTKVDEVLEQVDLADRQHDRVIAYSRGMTQRLGIARALLGAPDLLVLDEPLSSLDERAAESVMQIVARLRDEGAGIILVSHEFGAVERLATDLVILVGGKVVHRQSIRGMAAGGIVSLYREVVRVA